MFKYLVSWGKGEAMKETTVSRKARPAKHISFTKETFARLDNYLKKHFLGHRALSMIVDTAVSEYLDNHEGNGRV